MNTVHRLLLGVTRGRKGWFMANMPVLELITTGRKSGKHRAVMLTSPLQTNNEIVIVASRLKQSLLRLKSPLRQLVQQMCICV